MTVLNFDYFEGEDGYSDGTVETDLVQQFKEGKTAEEILKKKTSWPYIYHLSTIRENILNWFPFKKDCSILEIGSGCGALTALLSSKAKEVVSVELTKPRAEVNYYRNKDLNNVEIFVGNFNSMKFNQQFDYIILNGVLEYAGSFSNSESPYKSFLNNISQYLKSDGELLIAIENRIGLKYLNGAPEDHTGFLFSGINNYPGIDFVRTFTKNELIHLLESAGYHFIDFFYPFPDYKLPEIIVTDETINQLSPEKIEESYNFDRLKFFDEIKMIRTLAHEGILDRFFNSFLIVCSREELKENPIKYAKISRNRGKKFTLLTTIEEKDGKKLVRKTPINPEGKEHILKSFDYYQNHKDQLLFTPVKAELDGDSIIFEFLKDQTLEKRILDLLESNNKEEIKNILKKIKNYLLDGSEFKNGDYTSEFKKIFGNAEIEHKLHFKDDNNFDMLLSNIIDDDNYHTIDYEWNFDFPIPQEFIFFRLLYYFYLHQELADKIGLIELMEMTDEEGEEPFIKKEDLPTFMNWDENFGLNYVKDDSEEIIPMKTKDITDTLDSELARISDESSIYVDFGDEISEKDRIKTILNIDGNHFKAVFDLTLLDNFGKKDIERIRWDPIEDYAIVEDLNAKTNIGDLQYLTFPPYTTDCVYEDGRFVFLTEDPLIYLYGNMNGVDKIIIEGKIKRMKKDEIFNEFSHVHSSKKDLQDAYNDLNDELKKTKLKLIETENVLTNSNSGKSE